MVGVSISLGLVLIVLSSIGLAELKNLAARPLDYIIKVDKWNATRKRGREGLRLGANGTLCEDLSIFPIVRSDK